MIDWDSVPFPELNAEQLAAICERHGLPGGPIGRLPSTGVINSIYTIGGELVLRVPKDMAEGWKDTLTESVAVPVAHAAGIRTPALVAFDERCDIVATPYTVYERVHANPGGPQTAEGWRELGRELARLHERVTECPDPLHRLDDAGRSTDPDEILKRLIRGRDTSELEYRYLEKRLLRIQPAVEAAGGFRRFLHNDLSPGNLLHRDGDHTAIIDWGDAAWADPALELTNLPPEVTPLVLAGYREIRSMDGDDRAEDRIWWDQIWSAQRHFGEGGETRLRFLLSDSDTGSS